MQNSKPPEDDGLESRYSNSLRIGFNAYEFIFDFGQHHPPEKEHMHTRIVTSPSCAEAFSELLQESLETHERKYGQRREDPANE